MYDCRKTREFLELYLDSELESVPTQHVSAHLEQCAACRRELEIIRSQNELLARSVRNAKLDTRALRASIEAATVRRHRSILPGWASLRTPAWAMAVTCAVIVAVAALLYLPGKIGTGVSAFYRAVAENHWACLADPAAPDWVRSQPAIDELTASYLGGKGRAPATIGGDYQLTHARACRFNGERFLHLVYETRAGRAASLFVGRGGRDGLPASERSITLEGRAVQLAHVSDLHVMSAQVGERLLIAAAGDSDEATAVLLSALTNIRA